MSNKCEFDIPFSTSQQQQSFKLLELPPDLLALLESSEPPELAIASAPNSSSNPGNAVLRIGSKEYQMRQKNTSSPIMLLMPSSKNSTNIDDASTLNTTQSICSIATIQDTVELIAIEAGSEGAAPVKVNKWHQKFARDRATKANKN